MTNRRFRGCRLLSVWSDHDGARELLQSRLDGDLRQRSDLVGVQGPRDGSGRPDGEFWEGGSWFFKTRGARVFKEPEAARVALEHLRALKRRLGHLVPSPTCLFITQEPGGDHILWTATPTLTTLRHTLATAAEDERWPVFAAALASFAEGVVEGMRLALAQSLSIDANPANFALQGAQVRYIDDDAADRGDATGMEDALLARVLEYPQAPPQIWTHYLEAVGDLIHASGVIYRWHELNLSDRLLEASRRRRGTEALVQDFVVRMSRLRSRLGVPPA